MRRIGAIALVLAAGLMLGGGAQAKTTKKQLKCKAGYTHRAVRIPKRVHGVIVRRHGRIVYVTVERCVKTRKPARPKPSTPPPSTTPTTPPSSGSLTFPSSPPPTTRTTTTTTPTSTTTTATTTTATTTTATTTTATTTTATTTTPTTHTTTTTPPPPPPGGDPVMVAVGDIACGASGGSCKQGATEAIAQKQNPTDVFVLGDNQYDKGTYAEYEAAGAYNDTWGVFNPIVHPVPGNHEYLTSGAAGYFQYFGQVAHGPSGYYSFNVGSWHVLALNSDCSDSGCADALPGATTSAQTAWVQSDLAANPSACVLAMWHHPLISSGWTLGTPGVLPLWNALYAAHADVVLGGHDHLYERYAQMDPSGNATTSGIREFVVGTGGESLNGLGSSPSTLQAHDSSDFGVLVMTLHASSYDWKFVTTGGAVKDSGTTSCHGSGAMAASMARGRVGPAVAAAAGVASASTATARPVSAAARRRLAGPALVFDARPLRVSLARASRAGLPVAILASRAVDVRVTASLRRGHRLIRIASFYETESQIDRPHSVITLRMPARRLSGLSGATLVLRFAAEDGAWHRVTLTRTERLG